jgi:hypothetical protein
MRCTILLLAALASGACALGPGETDCITDADARVADYAPEELVLVVAAPDLDQEKQPYLSLKHGDEPRAVGGELWPETDPGVLARVSKFEQCERTRLRAFRIRADAEYWMKFWSEARPASGFEFGVGVPGLDADTELDVLGVALLERAGEGVVLGCGCLNKS